jgi:hypothetical protein
MFTNKPSNLISLQPPPQQQQQQQQQEQEQQQFRTTNTFELP